MNKKLILLSMSLLTVTMLQAQNIIRPKVECPNGIYVNSYNGVLFYQRPDVSVTNRNMRLEAVFYYNSSSNKKNYGYGNGWSLGSELRFVNDSLGVIIEQGDGRQDLYTRYGNSFEAPAGVFSTLSMEGDGYLLTYKDGTKYYFTDTVAKKVTMVKDRYDNAITFTYQEGNLVTASDISGRSLYFSWSNDLLSGIRTSFDDRTWSYGYDENGNLTSVTDPMGYTVHYAYNKDNRIKTFTDAEGYSTHISYNTDGMAHRVKTDLTDRSIRYEIANHRTVFVDYVTGSHSRFGTYIWDDKGRLIEIKNASGDSSIKFEYDDDNNLIRREDGNGNATTFTYDSNGNRLSETDALGYTQSYTYESSYNNMTSYTDKKGNLYTFVYNENGDLLEEHGPLNYSHSFTYNSFGQKLTSTDANHNNTVYGYDDFGNNTSITDPLGNITYINYSIDGLPLSITQPSGGVTTCTYDALQRPTQTIDALNNVIQRQYDKRGNMTSIIDANNNIMEFAYDALNQITAIHTPLESESFCYYNSLGNLCTTIDGLGYSTNYIYNANDKLVSVIDDSNETIHYAYDKANNLTDNLLPNGRQIHYQYDGLNRILSVSDQLGVLSEYQYDPNNNITHITDAQGNTRIFHYDALNRLIQEDDAMGFSKYYSYDNNGNIITYTDQNGHSMIIAYDACNRMISSTDALNYSTLYNYDSNGNLISVTDANGNVTTYQYNQLDLLTTIVYPNGKSRIYEYDANGNRIRQQYESGNQTQFTYDALNRLTGMIYEDNGITSSCYYDYDANSNMISAKNADATVLFTYDYLGRKLSESMNGDVTSYQYDDSSDIITYPSGYTVQNLYDERHRLIEVIENNNNVCSFAYNGNGFLTEQVYSNGISTHYNYDDNMRVTQIIDNRNTTNCDYSYDNVGNLLVKNDLINPSQSMIYSYDDDNRLVGVKVGELDANYGIPNPQEVVQHCLDALGNRTSSINNGVTEHYYSNNMNAYTQIVSGSNMLNYQYDDNGNLIDDGEHTYQYNNNNRLISIDDGESATYKYDALNRRIQMQFKQADNIHIQNYRYSANDVIEIQNPNENEISSYFYDEGHNVVSSINENEIYYYMKDLNGSTTYLTNMSSDIVESYHYGANGTTNIYNSSGNTIQTSAYNNSFMFRGQMMDIGTSNYLEGTRMYSSKTGNYTTTDPEHFKTTNNLYSVVSQSTSYVSSYRTNYDLGNMVPYINQNIKKRKPNKDSSSWFDVLSGIVNIVGGDDTPNVLRNAYSPFPSGYPSSSYISELFSDDYYEAYHETPGVGLRRGVFKTAANDMSRRSPLRHIGTAVRIASDLKQAKRAYEVYNDIHSKNKSTGRNRREGTGEFIGRVILPEILSKTPGYGPAGRALEDLMDWAYDDCYYKPTGMSDEDFELVQELYSPAYTKLWSRYDK